MKLPDGISDILPLSPAQQGMLFHIVERRETRARYVAVVSLRIKGQLSADRFQAAVQQTVDAHDTLRASFVYENVKAPVQVIRAEAPVPFELLDWRGDAEVDARLTELLAREQLRVFDLQRAPLMALHLIRVAEDAHVLVWTVQHIISDGWSLAVMLDEVFARYEGQTPAPSARFRDYLGWLKAQPTADSDTFWQAHLAGCAPSLLDLPAEDTPQGEGLVTAHIPARLIAKADALTKELRVTQNVLLSSVWSLVLRKITRSDDVMFGNTSAGRPAQIPGIGQAVGAYVNTLPVRHVIDASQSARDFLIAAGHLHRARAAHEFAALPHIRSLTDLDAGTALFDTLFVHQGLPPAQSHYDRFEIEPPTIRQSSNYALALLARPGDGLRLELIHDEARVAGYAAQGVLDMYCDMLEAILASPEARLDALLPLAVAPETTHRFEDVLAQFVAHAKRTPDAIAVTDQAGSVTYAALHGHVCQIAGALAGLKTDELVPVALPRGRDCIAAYLGVMMAGGAYVPIDLDYPQDRIAQILTEVDPKHVIAFRDAQLPVDAKIIDPRDLVPTGAVEPRNGTLAYVIFTSGSQGVPKGVEITRKGLAYSNGVRTAVFDSAPESFLLLSSLAFDSSVVGVYWTLASGGQLVIAPARAEQDPAALGTLIDTHGVTHTLCLPALYDAILGTVDAAKLSRLKTIIVAGEAPNAALSAQHRATLPHAQLYNEYGPTEGTVWCAAYDSTRHQSDPVPIGTPPPGTSLLPCDPDGAALPPGLTGELALGGPGIARGYHKAPAQTASRFANGWFHTGDLGRCLPTGEIVFLGRKDDQVKIRGHRIELGDIEAAARRHDPQISYAAVATKSDATQRIVLFAETKTVAQPLRPALEKSLPGHFLPSEIRAIGALPRLPNGKIDRAALGELAQIEAPRSAPQPKNDLETILAGIWTEVLGVEHIGRDDNFFDIGGDSLKSIALFSQADKLGLKMQPTDIFDHQTLAELARHLAERVSDPAGFGHVTPYQTVHGDGAKTPVFLLYANMSVFRNLVQGFGKDHPAALLFSHHFKGVEVPKDPSIEDLASDALAKLRLLRPQGPYVICGYSVGAYVAFELASQLRAQGEEVSLLSLIDPPYELAKGHPFAADRMRAKAKTVYHALAQQLGLGKDTLHETRVNAAYSKAVDAYKLRPYDGYCQVQLTPENPAMEDGSILSTQLSNVTVNHLKCTHYQLINEPAYSLAIAARIVEAFHNRSS